MGFEVAQSLGLSLDVLVVRKLGVPGMPELAMGALAWGGEPFFNERVIAALELSPQEVQEVVARESEELARRQREYRGSRPFPEIQGRTVLVVDDGLATGSTMKAALMAIKQKGPARLVVAVPVGAPQSCAQMRALADEVLCLHAPEHFSAVGFWFQDFSPTTDAEVRELLERAGSFPRGGKQKQSSRQQSSHHPNLQSPGRTQDPLPHDRAEKEHSDA